MIWANLLFVHVGSMCASQNSLGIRQKCPHCSVIFVLCSGCWKNHRYCTPECSSEARKLSVRNASKNYQATPQGKLNHSSRQNKYRAKLSRAHLREPSKENIKNKVTHHTTSPPKDSLTSPSDLSVPLATTIRKDNSSNTLSCRNCGKPVTHFYQIQGHIRSLRRIKFKKRK